MSVDTAFDGTEAFLPIDGALYSAPLGTALPASATATLAGAFVNHGYWTSDGASEDQSVSTSPIRAFQRNALIADPITEATATITVALLQARNAANKELYYGNAVDGTTGGVKWQPGVPNGRRVFVLDKVDADGNVERTTVGVGEAKPGGARVTVQGQARTLPLTISIYDDSATVYDSALVTGGGA